MKNNQTIRRETLIPILATIGTGLVVAAVVSILGAGWPWVMLILGIVIIIVVVFLSVPNTANLFSPVRIYERIYRTYIWLRYCPKYNIENPIIEKIATASAWVDAPPEPQYTAKFAISVKNKAIPIKVRLHEAIVCIEQKTQWEKNRIYLGNIHGRHEIEMKPFTEGQWNLCVCTSPRGGVILNPPDLQKEYQWGIQRIYVTLPGAGTKELHKGIYHGTK